MKNLFRYMGLFALLGLITQCSSGSSSGSTAELSTIEDLPRATAPVDGSSSSIMALHSIMGPDLATSGVSMDASSPFSDGDSVAACETWNMTKNAVQNAAKGDLILCYVQKIFAAADAAGITNGDGAPIDIYDGEYHVFTLDMTGFDDGSDEEDGEHGPPDHVKFKVVKSGGVITNFEMFACSSGTQNEYLSQTIDGTDFNMSTINIENGDTTDEGSSTTVTGTLGTSGHFTGTKTIAMNYTGSFEGHDQFGVYRFEQGSSSATMTGYMSGEFGDGDGGSGTSTNRIVSSMELLDSNTDGSAYDIGLLALGDGAVKGSWEGSFGEFDWTDTFSEGWNGDSLLEDSVAAASYLEDVSSATLPDETEPTIAFSDSSTYDCGDTPEATIVAADLPTLNTDVVECNNLTLSHDWVNCWEVVGHD